MCQWTAPITDSKASNPQQPTCGPTFMFLSSHATCLPCGGPLEKTLIGQTKRTKHPPNGAVETKAQNPRPSPKDRRNTTAATHTKEGKNEYSPPRNSQPHTRTATSGSCHSVSERTATPLPTPTPRGGGGREERPKPMYPWVEAKRSLPLSLFLQSTSSSSTHRGGGDGGARGNNLDGVQPPTPPATVPRQDMSRQTTCSHFLLRTMCPPHSNQRAEGGVPTPSRAETLL